MPLLSVPVPVEIIDMIIDELHDDTDALRNCSLVAQAFRPCSQKHLYTSIAITFPDQPSPEHDARGLLEVLLDRPRLARNVRRFNVSNYIEGFWDPHSERWTKIEDNVLIRIFEQLQSISSFKFSASNSWLEHLPPKVNFCRISPPLVLALSAMLQSPNIRSIGIHGFSNIPIVDIVIKCSSLKELSLSQTDPDLTDAQWHNVFNSEHNLPKDPATTACSSIQAKCGLEVLEMEFNAEFTVYDLYQHAILPQSRISMSHLREFRSSTSYMDRFGYRVMKHCTESLETLTLDCDGFTDIFLSVVGTEDLDIPQHLRSLRLIFNHGHTATPHQMTWLCQALEELAEEYDGNDLEEIVVVLHTDIPDNFEAVWCESDDWTEWFDVLLTGAREFPCMSQVTIFVQHPSHCEHRECVPVERYADINRILERKLRLLKARGMLSVRWMVVEESVNALTAAARAIDQEIEGGIFVGPDGRLGRGFPLL